MIDDTCTCRECGETFQKHHHLGMHYRIVHVWPRTMTRSPSSKLEDDQ